MDSQLDCEGLECENGHPVVFNDWRYYCIGESCKANINHRCVDCGEPLDQEYRDNRGQYCGSGWCWTNFGCDDIGDIPLRNRIAAYEIVGVQDSAGGGRWEGEMDEVEADLDSALEKGIIDRDSYESLISEVRELQ